MGPPTGDVWFYDGGAYLGSAALSSGVATFDTTSLGAGDHTIYADYQGDSDFDISSGNQTQTVNPLSLSVTALANNKTYDTTTTASYSLTPNGVLSGDTVNLSSSGGDFDTANVGTGKSVTISGIMISGGTNASNYTLSSSSTMTTADITPLGLDVSAAAYNKTLHDGMTAAAVSSLTPIGVLSGDSVYLSNTSADFDTADVGTSKVVTVNGISISGGTNSGNYTLNSTSAPAAADITPASTTTTVSSSNITSVLDADDVTFTAVVINASTASGIPTGHRRFRGRRIVFRDGRARFERQCDI